MTSAKNGGLVGDKHEPETEKGFQKKIANSISDIIASESITGRENVSRVAWLGFLLILLAFIYVGMNRVMTLFEKIIIMLSLIYAYQIIVIIVSAIGRIAQKAASTLGVLAMFTVTYEESGLNVMRAFFDGISKAAESSAIEDGQAETEVKTR